MRNGISLDNSLLARAIETLAGRLPAGWAVTCLTRQPRGKDFQPDALVELRGPDGERTTIVVEVKRAITAAEGVVLIPRLVRATLENKAGGSLLITSYLSPLARERLTKGGVSFIDLTGNSRIALDRPAVFIETAGAEKNPSPEGRGSRSLKGGSAARIVRALCDWTDPVGVRELARRAATDPGYVTRVLALLEREDVVKREGGKIVTVKWRDLLKRWTQDYGVTSSNRAVGYLEPRSIDSLLGRLQQYKGKCALTGSRAVPPAAATASARTVTCYVESPEQTAIDLKLRETDSGANVILLEPFDAVIWQRTRSEADLPCVAVSQCAADLFTGTGREPSEAEALMQWMENNESAWRA